MENDIVLTKWHPFYDFGRAVKAKLSILTIALMICQLNNLSPTPLVACCRCYDFSEQWWRRNFSVWKKNKLFVLSQICHSASVSEVFFVHGLYLTYLGHFRIGSKIRSSQLSMAFPVWLDGSFLGSYHIRRFLFHESHHSACKPWFYISDCSIRTECLQEYVWLYLKYTQ